MNAFNFKPTISGYKSYLSFMGAEYSVMMKVNGDFGILNFVNFKNVERRSEREILVDKFTVVTDMLHSCRKETDRTYSVYGKGSIQFESTYTRLKSLRIQEKSLIESIRLIDVANDLEINKD